MCAVLNFSDAYSEFNQKKANNLFAFFLAAGQFLNNFRSLMPLS